MPEAMPSGFTTPGRTDPYKNFKFLVKIDGNIVAGLQKCTGLKKTTETIDWRASGDPSVVRKLTGRTVYQPITLEAGLTQDEAFRTWAEKCNNPDGDAAMDLAGFRKEHINLILNNEEGTPVISYTIHRCWVSEYQAMPDLDSNAHAVAITMIKIECEGWKRDATPTGDAKGT
jgi:phage tail-like protein